MGRRETSPLYHQLKPIHFLSKWRESIRVAPISCHRQEWHPIVTTKGSGDSPGVVRLRDAVREVENVVDGVPVLRTAIMASLIVMEEDERTCTLVEGGNCLPTWAAVGVAQWIWRSAFFSQVLLDHCLMHLRITDVD